MHINIPQTRYTRRVMFVAGPTAGRGWSTFGAAIIFSENNSMKRGWAFVLAGFRDGRRFVPLFPTQAAALQRGCRILSA